MHLMMKPSRTVSHLAAVLAAATAPGPATTFLLAASPARRPLGGMRMTEAPSFADDYGDALPAWLVDRTAALGFTTPTPVQSESIAAVLSGKDAIIQAKTGSGKTLAYMLPLIASLKPRSSVQALVILPTRELAQQVALVARRLVSASPKRLAVMSLLDGTGARRQRKWLVAEPPQVVVGNVQQVDAVLRAGLLRLSSLKLLVVDEVDACLTDDDTCFLLERMLGGQLALPAAAPPRRGRPAAAPLAERQTLFVSATLPQRSHFQRQCVAERWCRDKPVLVHSEPRQLLPAQLIHGWAPCDDEKRVLALRTVLRRHAAEVRGAILFVREDRPIRRIAEAVAGIIDEGAPDVLSEGEPLPRRATAVRDQLPVYYHPANHTRRPTATHAGARAARRLAPAAALDAARRARARYPALLARVPLGFARHGRRVRARRGPLRPRGATGPRHGARQPQGGVCAAPHCQRVRHRV